MDTAKTKIAILSHSLGGGGAERFAAHLSFILEGLHYEIYNIILTETQDYEYAGKLLNLGLLAKNQPAWKRKFTKASLLKKYLSENEINILIDNRPRNFQLSEWLVRQIYGDRKVYYLIQNYKLANYLPQSQWLANMLYGKAEKIICVSQAIEAKVKAQYHFKNTVTIENPVDLSEKGNAALPSLPEKFILYFGRFDEKAKNFTLMLEAFAASKIYNMGYQLVLMGEGPDRDYIGTQISKSDLGAFVTMIPYQKNPFAIVRKSRFTLLTSHFEGFPLSIVESLGNRIPVVAVDCESGPREVIQNEKNGLLVANYNADALADAINRMVSDESLYNHCRKNAAASVAHLSLESIAKKWAAILPKPL